jgi:hypothetical protein
VGIIVERKLAFGTTILGRQPNPGRLPGDIPKNAFSEDAHASSAKNARSGRNRLFKNQHNL